jgi:hypothetical protein
MAGGGKPDKHEYRRRVQTVYKMMLRGQGRQEILRFVAESTDWGVAERTVENYMAAANRLLEAQAKTVEQRELGLALARVDDLYARAVTIGDLRSALAAQKERNTLLGLYAPAKTEITGAGGGALKAEIRFVWADDAPDGGGHERD